MLFSTDGADEQGLQVSLRELVFDWAERREFEAGVSGMQVHSVYPGRHEDGL